VETLIFLLVLAFVGWAAFTQISARQQTSVSCSYDIATTTAIVTGCFGRSWISVGGKGDLNYKPRARNRPPVISVSFKAAQSGGSEVDIWCSAFTKRYGLLEHGQLVWRKKRAVARALTQARQTVHSQVQADRTPPYVAGSRRDSFLAAGGDGSPSRRPVINERREDDPPRNAESSCAHEFRTYLEFGDIRIKGDPPYPYREFWNVTSCTKCGEAHREGDEYYGDDMAEIHWKWR